MSQPDGSERRRHTRVEATMPCTLVQENGDKQAFELLDLSESGVRMRCKADMTAMTRIQVAMVLPASRVGRNEDVRLDTEGVVVWSHAVNEGIYDTGVFFPELSDDQRGLLQAFVLSAV
ncbi:MAG: PilZ domain-containing protein [Planctomycetota bacterium]|nr:PilZ domain-containing protein [Planctomycetota bacterium]